MSYDKIRGFVLAAPSQRKPLVSQKMIVPAGSRHRQAFLGEDGRVELFWRETSRSGLPLRLDGEIRSQLGSLWKKAPAPGAGFSGAE